MAKKPLDIRVNDAIIGGLLRWHQQGLIVTVSRGLAGLSLNAARLCWKGYTLAKWTVSRKVSELVYSRRMQACKTCEGMTLRDDGAMFCGPCNCPKWRWSNMAVKNTKKAHNCPLGIQDGSFAVMAVNQKTKGGCKGGCGKKVKPSIIRGGSVLEAAAQERLIRGNP